MKKLSWIASGVLSLALAELAFVITNNPWSMLLNIIYAILAIVFSVYSNE
jgi:hypothetical protein